MSLDPTNNPKRSYESLDNDHKRAKLSSRSETSVNDDLEYLKRLITQELSAVYEERFVQINSQLTDLNQKYTELLYKVNSPPALPPRSNVPGAPFSGTTTASSAPSLEPAPSDSAPSTNGTKPVLMRKSSNNEESKPKHTFGGTLFSIKPMVATPTNSQSAANVAEQTPKDAAAKPSNNNTQESPASKPVFGTSTTFGNSSFLNSLKERKNVFADLPSNSPTSSNKPVSLEAPGAGGSPSSFGSSSFGANSKFSNAFQNSLNKKSFLDGDKNDNNNDDSNVPENNNDHNDDDAHNNSSSTQDSPAPQIKLAPVKNTTGEEDEKSHFNSTCKLFELSLDNISEGWKERGLGQIHLNQSYTNPNQVRLVMRSHGLLRVILNTKITSTTEFFKGSEATLNPGKYLRFNSINNNKPVQYLLKFSNQNLRDELVSKIDDLKQQISDSAASSKDNSKEPDEKSKETEKKQSTETGVKWT